MERKKTMITEKEKMNGRNCRKKESKEQILAKTEKETMKTGAKSKEKLKNQRKLENKKENVLKKTR